MTINSFFIPTDKDILRDIKEDARSIKFTNEGLLSQSLEKTIYTRSFIYRFDAEKKEHKINYVKIGLVWEFNGITSVKDRKNNLSKF